MYLPRFFALWFLLLGMITACNQQDAPHTPSVLYYNGNIITMEGSSPEYVEAVVQSNGKIQFIGTLEAARQKYPQAENYDLQGLTLMPGFIEPHIHPVSLGAFLLGNEIVAPHEWKMPHKTYPAAPDKASYLDALRSIVAEKGKKEDYLVVWGYHKAWHGKLTLEELNAITGDIPVIIYQRSGHEMILNDAAMKKFAVDPTQFKHPEQIDLSNNHFRERAFQELKTGPLASIYADTIRIKTGMERFAQLMLQNGITAVAEPGFGSVSFEKEYALLNATSTQYPYFHSYLIPGFPQQFTEKKSNEDFHAYLETLPEGRNTDHITILNKQYKTYADGAIYALTLQLRDTFFNCPDCHSEWIIPPAMHEDLFAFYWQKGYQIHTHVTGDLGLDAMLDMVEKNQKTYPREDHRTTLHHLGLFDEAQAARMAALGVEASVNPYYIWALGNKYSEVGLGAERASRLSGLGFIATHKVPFSLHSDFAMAPAEPLTLAWVAATRITDQQNSLRPDLSVSVFDAFKGITIDAARTIAMEQEIGSIKPGKVASFTLLTENPFAIDPQNIKDIKVQGIIYKGSYYAN